MAASSNPYGLIPLNMLGGGQYTAGVIRELPMTVNQTNGIFTGDLVNLTSGQPTSVTATPTTTANANTPIGVCVGVRYTDPVLKWNQFAQFLPAGAITAGYTNVFIRVIDDPNALFVVQADGSLARTNVGLNATLKNFSAQSTTTGNSKVQLTSGTVAGTNTFAVRIVDMLENAQSTAGDAFTDCIVRFNQGVHAYLNAAGQ